MAGAWKKERVLVESGNYTSICPKGMIIVMMMMMMIMMMMIMMIQQWDICPL
jgi:hypothetical protein